MSLSQPCITSTGPKDAKIVIVGEAPGEQESLTGIPFIGASGQELNRMLLQAGLARGECYLTNVLWTRPPQNKFEAFCVKKAELPSGYSLPPIGPGQYLHPDFLPEIERLHRELRSVKPNLIILAGGKSTWAVLGDPKISRLRGTVVMSPFGKCLPIFHPAVVFRDWSVRPIIVADLIKAEREAKFPEIRRPLRRLLVSPTFEEACNYLIRLNTSPEVAIDVETFMGQITDLGIAPSPFEGISVPFYDTKRGNYWSLAEELHLRRRINNILCNPAIAKIMQNGLYDIQYLLREGFKLRNCFHDTMLAHHALHPEVQKALGFMGSLYTDEVAWKSMRTTHTLKRED